VNVQQRHDRAASVFPVAAHLDLRHYPSTKCYAVGDSDFQTTDAISKMQNVAAVGGRCYWSFTTDDELPLCDRCAVLEKGKLAFLGDTQFGHRSNTSSTCRTSCRRRICSQHSSRDLDRDAPRFPNGFGSKMPCMACQRCIQGIPFPLLICVAIRPGRISTFQVFDAIETQRRHRHPIHFGAMARV